MTQRIRGSLGTLATYNYGTEGLSVYVPGSGIVFKNGITYNLAGASWKRYYNNHWRVGD